MPSLPERLERLEDAVSPERRSGDTLVARVGWLEEQCLGSSSCSSAGLSLLERVVSLEAAVLGDSPGPPAGAPPGGYATQAGLLRDFGGAAQAGAGARGGGRAITSDFSAMRESSGEACGGVASLADAQRHYSRAATSTYTRLYWSHFLSQFGDRMWKFAVPVLFISVWDNDLKPAAIFGFLLYGLKLVILPFVGRGIDEIDRLRLVRASTFGQGSTICLSVMLLALLGHRVKVYGHSFPGSAFDMFLFFVLTVVGVIGDIFATAGTIGIEKDWVVVIADGDVSMLAILNSTLRRIDLCCKLVAPLLFGLMMALPQTAYGQVQLGTALVFVWSATSVMPIYWAWKSVYYEYPELQRVKAPKKKTNPLMVLMECGATYVSHPVFGASFAYCCLYFTVLSDHHPLTTAFLMQGGVSTAVLGIARASGAFTGILGTFLFPHLRARMGLLPANVAAAWGFVLCIVPISLFWVPDADGSSAWQGHCMLAAIVVSRVCLWIFDLANVQTMQESVAESSRGEVNAAQSALCQLMELVMATISIFASEHFRVLVISSAFGVSMAAITVTCWSAKQRRLGQPLSEPLSEIPLQSTS